MELERRSFFGMLLLPLLRRILPARWCDRLYPGPVRPLDLSKVRKPGRWAG
jgi:hypothetical protein